MGSEPRAEQLVEELSLIELESGRLLDDDPQSLFAGVGHDAETQARMRLRE